MVLPSSTIIAFVYGLLGLLCFSYFLSPISKFLIWVLRFVPSNITFNFEIGLFVYLLASLLVYAFLRNSNKKTLKEAVNTPLYGYFKNNAGRIILTKNWIYIKYFIKYLFVIAGIWSSSLIWGIVDSSAYMPYFTIYCVLVIYEMYYFLDVDTDDSIIDKSIDIEDESPLNIQDYEKLWSFYKLQFGTKILAGRK